MLYLFLVTVSDAQGLSFYSEGTLCQSFNWEQARLSKARKELVSADLIAFRHPYYQVLSLDRPANRPAVHRQVAPQASQQQRTTNSPRNSDDQLLSLAQIMQSILDGGQNRD